MSKLTKYKFSDLYEMSSGISSSKEQAGHGSPFISFSTVFNNYFLPEELPDLMDTSLKDVIDEGRQQTGGGTGQTNGGNTNGRDFLDLSSVKNQIEADKIIESYLLANGLTRDSQQFAEQSLKIRTENKISDLPIR